MDAALAVARQKIDVLTRQKELASLLEKQKELAALEEKILLLQQ